MSSFQATSTHSELRQIIPTRSKPLEVIPNLILARRSLEWVEVTWS